MKSNHSNVLTFWCGFTSGRDRQAWLAAHLLHCGNLLEFMRVLLRSDLSATTFRAIAAAMDAIDEKPISGPHFRLPTPTCVAIIESYWAAAAKRHNEVFGKGNEGIGNQKMLTEANPTLAEVREQYRKKAGSDNSLPADWTIRKVLKGLHLPYRAGKLGRPKKFARKRRA